MRDFQTLTRSPAYGRRGMAATSHPLATLAAVDCLRGGGNAVDAAITAAATLAVVELQMTGIGGDCFVLYAPAAGGVLAYNGSGAAPKAATLDWFRENGVAEIGPASPHSVTVPGAVEAWHRISTDHGRLPFADLLRPAIGYARDGFAVTPRVAWDWSRFVSKLDATEAARARYLPGGAPPEVGDVFRQPELADTLSAIAEQGARGFYEGAVARAMADNLAALGNLLTVDDFAAHRGAWEKPVSTSYRGYDIYECPPNGHGLVALIMLNILEGFAFDGSDPLDPRRIHLVSEAARLAYRDRDRHIGDPRHVDVPVAALLSKDYAARQRAHIREDRAMAPLPEPEIPSWSDTVYLTVVDGAGNAVSFINSLFNAFGSGLTCPKTGVLFQNRGFSFRLTPGHPNAIAPGKRPMHTIMPGMMMKDGAAVMPFGVMGGHYQPTGHTHFVGNVVDFDMDPQAAAELPRFFHYGGVLELESGVPEATATALAAMGHEVRRAPLPHGGAQAIRIDRGTRVLTGGSDPRKDGCALGY